MFLKSYHWYGGSVLLIIFISVDVSLLQYAPMYVGNDTVGTSIKVYKYAGDGPPDIISNRTTSVIHDGYIETGGRDVGTNRIYFPVNSNEDTQYVNYGGGNNADEVYYPADVDEGEEESVDSVQEGRQETFTLGFCSIVVNRQCPHPDVRFFLFTQQHPDIPEEIFVGAEPLVSNLTLSSFDPNLPSKVIIHGFNSDMLLHGLIEIKNQYLFRDKYNIFTIDWGAISQGPCYPAAVWNARFAGRCGALLIDRLRETGNSDIHLIGFSLGAHVSGFIANNVRPYRIPRITGLDPALPAFTTPNLDDKLDKTDALFVDVIHTNAFFQGKVEECGHVDFYMNGGSIQPGCWADERSLACNHHRAAFYYAESINSPAGFWGWYCPSYIMYLLGRCPPKEPQIPMGEDVVIKPLGMHLVITDSVSPFAVGRFEGPTIDILIRHADRGRTEDFQRFKGTVSEDCRHADHQLHPDLGDLNWDGLDFSPLLEDRPAQLPFPEHPPPPPPPGHEIQPALPPHLLEFPPIHQELPLELRPGFAKEPSPPPPPFPPRPQIPPFDDLLDELDDYLLVR